MTYFFKNPRYLVIISFIISFLIISCTKESPQKHIQNIYKIRSLGLAYLEESKLDEAEQEFIKLIEAVPEEALGYANLGLVYLTKGRFSEAEERLNIAQKIDPANPSIQLLLANVYEMSGKRIDAIKLLEKTLELNPNHNKSRFKLAQLYARSRNDSTNLPKIQEHLKKLSISLPANIMIRFQLVELLLQQKNIMAVKQHLEEIRRILPDWSEELEEEYRSLQKLLHQSDTQAAFEALRTIHNQQKVTALYRSGARNLVGQGGVKEGFPVTQFSTKITRTIQNSMIPDHIQFVDITQKAGISEFKLGTETQTSSEQAVTSLSIGDFDSDDDPDLFITRFNQNQDGIGNLLLENQKGVFIDKTTKSGLTYTGKSTSAIFADFDNDSEMDLFVTNDGTNLFYKNLGNGKFEEISKKAGILEKAYSHSAMFVDLDHEGDLDLYVTNSEGNYLYRNNLDGTFLEQSKKMRIDGGDVKSKNVVFGDFDEDGDIDLFILNENSNNTLYTNLRQGYFDDITEKSELVSDEKSAAVAAGDYNNDGYLDLCVISMEGGNHRLYINNGDGSFQNDSNSDVCKQVLKDISGLDVCFLDFDNDGFLDLAVAGANRNGIENSRGLFLLHNNGSGEFRDASALLPEIYNDCSSVTTADYEGDGDLDLFTSFLDGSVRIFRNDGGNANHWLPVQIMGLSSESGKNNLYGIGAKVEVKAGDLYQMQFVTGPVTHFGLGDREKVDVVRVLWSNGIPQNAFTPEVNEKVTIVEDQVFKGSCPFLYTWDGSQFKFHTDILLRSSLGAPMDLVEGNIIYFPSQSSEEYLKIPGQMLKAKNDKYTIQITEELWEVGYIDELNIITIDHPDSAEIYVDEKYIPPPYPPLKFYPVKKKNFPVSAENDQGEDLIPIIKERDHTYTSGLSPTRFQGISKSHDLIMDLGDLSGSNRILLFMTGWIFPTDGSINLAIGQSKKYSLIPPSLQVPDKSGVWRTVIDNISFPMGKDKTIILDLSDKFLASDYRVRIRTNLQLYWDYIFFSTSTPVVPIRKTTLNPVSADLHFRGFSELISIGQSGPQWFDYNSVKKEPKWRNQTGKFTRFGDVTPLLQKSDNKYVILNPGDEITINFDVNHAPELLPGWDRDFLIFNNGWIKEGDLNTAKGESVLPLPFHEMSNYPYSDTENYPDTKEYQDYINTYNNREVTSEKFNRLLMDLKVKN